MEKIVVSPEVRARLVEEFGVSEQSVYRALGYAVDGYTPRSIRQRALELGGELWKKVSPTPTLPSREGVSPTPTLPSREGVEGKHAFCPECSQAKYPACNEGIPCCKCDDYTCNSRQECSKNV